MGVTDKAPPMRPLLLLMLLLPSLALAQPMRVLETVPRASSVMAGNRQEFSIRFDAPVDHNASRLEVLQAGVVVRELRPRLNASPDTLHAIAGSLAAGDYTLRWRAVAHRGAEVTEGSLGFAIGP